MWDFDYVGRGVQSHRSRLRRLAALREQPATEETIIVVHLISYDLNGHERPSAYQSVKTYIEQHAVSYRRPLYSQWLVETADGPQAWVNGLKTVLDADDYLFVVEVRRPYQGWLPETVWTWLNERVRP